MKPANPRSSGLSGPALMLGALGVVFGDIGTSPLYALRESLHVAGGASVLNIMGVLSLISWALFLVVTFKYIMLILRADNRGEGGILALTVLAIDQFGTAGQRQRILVLGLLGAALFYGDALITPAISVLSAVEGLAVITPAASHFVIPVSLVLLMALFGFQRVGTGAVGGLFGPIMLVWFAAIGTVGVLQIMQAPQVLQALNPLYAWQFAAANPGLAFLTMGAVVLAITGAEALYADMGHFGRRPIQRVWLFFVGPALLANYFGQGALLLQQPTAIENPFYLLVPSQFLWPMVILAATATVIASQAVISGAFSLTHQAIQLGYLPRLEVQHTNPHNPGQIYLPALNYLMLGAIILLVLNFKNSSNLAAAYGIAVTGTMLLTTLLATTVLSKRNGWSPVWVGLFAGVFVLIDSLFLTANLHKIPEGGWFPLALGAGIFFIMHSWLRGRATTHQLLLKQTPTLEHFLHNLKPHLQHTQRTAVFLTSDLNHAPPAMVYNVAHNNVLHDQIIILKITRARLPRYPESERIRICHYSHHVSTVQVMYGFMENPNIPELLKQLGQHGLPIRHPQALSYFLSTHTYVPSPNTALNRWQEPMFMLLDKLSQSAVTFFQLPRKHVIEIGNHLEI